MFRRLEATGRAPQIMVLSMLRSFGKIGPQIDKIWAWLSRGHRWSPGLRKPLISAVTGPSLLVNCYLEIKGEPPPLNRHNLVIFHPIFTLFFKCSFFKYKSNGDNNLALFPLVQILVFALFLLRGLTWAVYGPKTTLKMSGRVLAFPSNS